PSGSSSDWGGYFGSVETRSLPAFRTLSRRPPAIGAALAGGVDATVPVDAAGWLAATDGAELAAVPPPVHAPATSATVAKMVRRPRIDISWSSSFARTARPSPRSAPRL